MANLVNEANRKKNIQFNKYNQQIKGKLNLSAAIKKVNTTVGGVVNQ